MKKFIFFLLGCAITYIIVKKPDVVSNLPGFVSDAVGWCSDGVSELTQSFGMDGGKAIPLPQMSELSPEEKARRLENWVQDRSRYAEALSSIRRTVESRTNSPGYVYRENPLKSLNVILEKFEDAIRRDDYACAPELFEAAENAYSSFMEGCRWKKGRSRGHGTHMHSGAREGEWEADPGYEIVNGTALRRVTCNYCSGQGYTSSRVVCGACNGAKCVPNPAYGATRIVDGLDGLLDGLGGKKGRQIGRAVRGVSRNIPKYLNCDACNGTGSVSVTNDCRYCNARGFNYKE